MAPPMHALMDDRMRDDGAHSVWLPRLLAWLYVGVPAAWGVAQVIVKSVALFR